MCPSTTREGLIREEHARQFSEGPLREMIRHRFGVECNIEYFHAPLVVKGTGSLRNDAS